MKKSIFLFFAAILCAMTANAQWYLMGTVTDWSSGKQMTGDSKVVSVTINLKANTSYELKIKNGNSWYGNGGTMSSTNNLAWGFSTSNGSNAKIKTTDAGDYTFTWYISDKKLSVTYPNHNYIVAGDGDVMEDDWSPNSPKNKMEKQDDGTYRLVKTNRSLSVKTYGYKLTVGSWSVNQYPNDNVALKVTAAGNYNVVFTYNPKNGQLSHELVPIYTITASANPATAGTITGAGTYAKDASVTLEATPNAGYKFVNWTVGGMEKSTETTYSFTASANVNAVANFELSDPEVPTYAISVSANDDAMGTVTGAGDYTEGSSVTLTATPKAGYRFVNWTVGSEVKSTEATYSFTASEALTIVANFEAIPKYDITVKAVVPEAWTSTTIGIHYWGDGISGTSTPVATEKDGNWNKYTIKDVLEGQSVNVIFLNGTSWGSDKSNQTADITGITEDKCFQISAKTLDSEGKCTFTEVDCAADIKPEGDVYTMMGVGELGLSWDLTTTGNDMTKQADGTYTLVKDSLDLATTGNYEYKVIKNHSWDWSVPSGNTNQKLTVDKDGTYTITFTLSADKKKLTADAVRNTRTVAVTAENGKVEGIENNGVYILGKEVTITATANDHYVFVNWTKGEEIVSTENPYIFNVTADVDLVANFAKKTYTVTATATNGTVEGADTYEHGAEVTLTATAAEGYEFVNWTENEEEVSTDAEYTFEVLADHNLVANFKKKTYTVTATATNGTVTGLVEGGIYEHGATATLTATPAFDYEFEKWSNGSTDNPLTITVTDNETLEAIFAEVAATKKTESGVFSISAHKTATFATGNLQHNVSTGEWRFAKQQYQVVGEQNIEVGNPDFKGWIDMLGWSNGEANNYGVNPSNVNELYDGEFVDWGTKMGEGWSTLSADEWKYLLNTRENAASLKQIAKVGDILGIMLFPDNWTLPKDCNPTPEINHDPDDGEETKYDFTSQNYTLEQWTKLEQVGAVFLPAAGRRTGGYGNMINYDQVEENNEEMLNGGYYRHQDNTNIYCYYWTSTINEETKNVSYLHNIVALGNEKYTIGTGAVWGEKGRYGQSVRLAKVVYDKHTVNATAENGTVTGAGEYTHGDTVTLTATHAEGYEFVNWTVGKDTVSTEVTYTFTVEADVNLVANFQEVVPVITHTVTWYTAVGETTEVTLEETAAITKPATDPEMEGYVFMGWTNECFVAEDGSDFAAIEDFGIADADKEYYAVFAKEMTTGGATNKTYSFDITKADFNTTSYAANNTTKTSKATASDGSTLDVQWTSNQVMLQSSAIQFKKNEGYIYNNTDLKNIISVEVTSTAGTFTTYYGTSSQPSNNTSVGSENGYFKIKVGSATGKCSNIKITFAHVISGEPTTTYSNYMTTCTPEEYTIVWSVNGVTKTTTVVEGDALVLPEAPAAPDACSDKVFMGWATTATVYADGSAINWVNETIIPESDNTYYAVFATEIIDAENSEIESVTLAYAGGTTANMTVDSNNAAIVGLNAEEWSVTAAKGGSNNAPGLNKDNDIRLYYSADGSNTITVSSLVENVTISNITITYTGDNYSNSKVLVNDAVVTGTDGTYTINANSFVITNGNTSNAQVRIKSIVINYTKPSITYTDYATTCKIPEYYTITFDYNMDAGYITVNDVRISEKKVTYEEGTELTIKALTFNNYRFDAWADEEGADIVTTPEYTFTVTGDVVLQAIFTSEQGAVGTGVENNNVVTSETMKVIQNGRLFIIRGGKIYNAQGQVVK